MNRQGFTLVEIMIVVAIIGILASIAVPNFIKNRATAQASSCIRNMQQLETAMENYRTANEMRIPLSFNEVVGLDGYLRSMPKCPSAGVYSFTPEENDDRIAIRVYCSIDGEHTLYKTNN